MQDKITADPTSILIDLVLDYFENRYDVDRLLAWEEFRADAHTHIADLTTKGSLQGRVESWFKLHCPKCGSCEGLLKDLVIIGSIPNNEAQCPSCGLFTHRYYSGSYAIQCGR